MITVAYQTRSLRCTLVGLDTCGIINQTLKLPLQTRPCEPLLQGLQQTELGIFYDTASRNKNTSTNLSAVRAATRFVRDPVVQTDPVFQGIDVL